MLRDKVSTHGCGSRQVAAKENGLPISNSGSGVGLDGLFFEAHATLSKAQSDATNQIYLSQLSSVVKNLLKIDS